MSAANTPPPRRRPAAGGYARGDEKQARIIEAALRRFGANGYEGTSTRQIAQEAGVNPPALQYYFNGKEGLYDACGRHIAQRFIACLEDLYQTADQVRHDDPAAALDTLCDIVDRVADFLFETAETAGWGRFLARAQSLEGARASDQATSQVVEDGLYAHCARLVGLVIGRKQSAVETRLRTLVILGQLTAFHLGRDDALRRLDWPDLRGPRLRKVKAVLRSQTRSALGVPDSGISLQGRELGIRGLS